MPRDTVRLLDEDDLIRWREGTMTAIPSKDEPGGAPDAITHSTLTSSKLPTLTDFHKANIQLRADTKTSLLTKALQPSQDDNSEEAYMAIEMARHRSSRSTTSSASTADLTSDGGLTSPTRTSTPSPPFPPSSYMSLAPYTLGPKLSQTAFARAQQKNQDSGVAQQVNAAAVPKPDPAVEALVKKRCISFACAAQKPQDFVKSTPSTNHAKNGAGATTTATTAAPKRTIKFACNGPQPDRNAVKAAEPAKVPRQSATPASPAKAAGRHTIRSPTLSRKLRSSTPQPKAHRDSTSTIRRASQSPAAVRSRKPKYIVADEEALESSEATRFHEFASDEPQEDDWIRKDTSTIKGKLTIHDTLKKENAIRQLGKEAEEEALEDDEDDDDDEGNDDDDDDENDDEDDDDDDDDDDEDDIDDDDNTVDGSDVDLDASDGNETDNEAGFADSDEESDRGGEFHFWSPGMSTVDTSVFRSSVPRAPSESSIDSLSHMSPTLNKSGSGSRKTKATRKIRIRPGTPDLPDSTDFVCGTLDEDRPLEEAYVSCMEARKREKRHVIPQDIDPSFPTSDPEDEEDENDEVDQQQPNDSDEGLWLHGKFEDSESETRHRRRTRKSPKHSPKRLVSPPPQQKYRSPPTTTTRRSPRLRSPPPRRAKSPPPRRAKSPAPTRTRARAVKWPEASASISFAPIPNRPDPTHTKSLPRRPNAFCQQYRAAQLAFAADMEGGGEHDDNNNNTDGYTRGAIDIVKGLEQKRQRRKDKFFSKLCNRARKGQGVERRPQPGKGAERMRELGLQMAGKTAVECRNGGAEYVLSV